MISIDGVCCRLARLYVTCNVQPRYMYRTAEPSHSVQKYQIKEVGGFYKPSSENKGADQLCRYCTVDLRLYYRMSISPAFS